MEGRSRKLSGNPPSHTHSPHPGAIHVEEEHTLTQHSQSVLYFAASPAYFVSSSQDSSIKIWDLEYLRCKYSLDGHKGPVLFITVYKQFLISAGSDKAIKIWNLENKKCNVTLYGHLGCVYSLAVFDDILFCGCQDATIQYFNLESVFASISQNPEVHLALESHFESFRNSHNGFVYCLTSTPKCLISGAGDGLIKIWNVLKSNPKITLDLVKVLSGHKGRVNTIVMDEANLYSGSSDCTVKVWDLDSFYLTRTLTGHTDEILSVAVNPFFVISGCYDGSIYIWDKKTTNLLQKLVHPDIVHAVFIKDDLLLSGNNKGHIKIWKLPTSQTTNLQQSLKLPRIPSMVDLLAKFVSFQSVSSNPDCRQSCWKAAKWVLDLMGHIGMNATLLEGAEGRNPLVFGQTAHESDKLTICIYGHYDVVPADEEEWDTSPFCLTGKDGYLYGRGVTDDKGPIIAILTAIDELIHKEKNLPVNIKILLEGEEETDSSGLKEAVASNSHLFKDVNLVLVSNNYWIDDVHPCLTCGFRGVISMKVSITGPTHSLHSGINGGVLVEPMVLLVHLLSTLVSVDGKVQLEGFYDDVSSPTPEQEQNILNHAPLSFQHFQKKLGVKKLLADTPRNVLLKQWFQPSMTIHGITTTPKIQTQSPSFIANSVEGYISIRTVPCQNPEKLIQLVTQHLNKEILKYAQVMAYQMEVSVNKKGDWWVVRTETPFFKALSEATKECWETSPMMVREGGTIPIVSYLEKVLHTQALILPMGQASDAAHLKNERFRLENFYKGKDVIKTFIKNINHHQ